MGQPVGRPLVRGSAEQSFIIEETLAIAIPALRGVRVAAAAVAERRAVQNALRAEAEFLATEEAAGLTPGSLPAGVGEFLPAARARTAAAGEGVSSRILNMADGDSMIKARVRKRTQELIEELDISPREAFEQAKREIRLELELEVRSRELSEVEVVFSEQRGQVSSEFRDFRPQGKRPKGQLK